MDAEELRASLTTGRVSPRAFRTALMSIPPERRDSWLDQVFGLDELPQDGPELPRGCVPYLPSSVRTLLRMIDLAEVGASDVFVDVGSGLGRVTALTHLLTGARAIGLEIQPALVQSSRALAARVNARRVSVIEGDAAELIGEVSAGSVFFLYSPFSGDRLSRVMAHLESVARTREIRVCSVGSSLPSRSWLLPVSLSDELAVYRCRGG